MFCTSKHINTQFYRRLIAFFLIMKEASCNLTRRVVPIASHDMFACISSVAVEVIGPWV